MSDTTQDDHAIELTKYTRFSGCGAKLGPGMLDRALCGLTQPVDPDLLVGFAASDDGGVYRISDDVAIVQSLDFFPPIVDDPYMYGRIAAVNALSDIYAMGGRPVTAMSIVGFPLAKLGIDILRQITEGALSAVVEAGASLVGGHSIQDEELKFGLSVTGTVHPQRIWQNNTLQPGDSLILTKPLGTGTINMALRQGVAHADAIAASEQGMAMLNRQAAEVLAGFPVHACTDVTGFGLGGHAAEMIVDSGCGIAIQRSGLELLPHTMEYLQQGLMPGGTGKNREFRGRMVAGLDAMDPAAVGLLFDPQTSGGLLAAVPAAEAQGCLQELRKAGVAAFPVGSVHAGPELIHWHE